MIPVDDAMSPSRILARSLVHEALHGRAAAMPVPPVVLRRRRAYSKGEILEYLQRFYEAHGHFPTRQEWARPALHGLPAYDVTRRLWGSVEAAKAAVRERMGMGEECDGRR